MFVYVVGVQSGTVFVGGGGGGVIIGIVSELEDPPPPQPESNTNDKSVTVFMSLFRNGSIYVKFLHESPDSGSSIYVVVIAQTISIWPFMISASQSIIT